MTVTGVDRLDPAPRTRPATAGATGTEVSALEASVLDAVDAGEVLTDLAALVAIPSVGGTEAEHEVQAWCARRLHGLGADVDHWRIDVAEEQAAPGYPGEEAERTEAWGCVGVLGGSAAPGAGPLPALVLNGHTDVVPPGDARRWPGGDPWALHASGDLLRGRGTCDMKAGVAAVLGAVAALRRAGVALERPLAVHAVVGEEDGGLGAFATLRRGHSGEACVIAEPTTGELVVANTGALTFRLTVPGRSVHGSARASGVSAIDAAIPVLVALHELEARRNASPPPAFGHLDLLAPLSVGTVQAGEWASTVPDRLIATGRYGVLPGEPVEQARATFESAVSRVCAGNPWLAANPVVVEWVGGQFASGTLAGGGEHALAKEVAAAVVSSGSRAPSAVGAPYGSDLRLYSAAGIATLQHGPGDVRDAHSIGEPVRADDVVATARALALLAVRRCGVVPRVPSPRPRR